MCLEELRLFSIYEKVLARIESIPETLSELVVQIIKRLETDCGRNLVQDSLAAKHRLRSSCERALQYFVTSGQYLPQVSKS